MPDIEGTLYVPLDFKPRILVGWQVKTTRGNDVNEFAITRAYTWPHSVSRSFDGRKKVAFVGDRLEPNA